MLDEILDFFGEAWDYIIGFEWLGDIIDFFTGMFENLGELSYMGLGFAVAVIIFIYALSDYMLKPFLVHMTPISSLFWMIATYIISAIVGYLLGKSLFDNE